MSNWRFLNYKYTSMYPMYAFLPLSILVSLLVLIYNEGITWQMLQQSGFYIAWLVSFLVTLILIVIVFLITLWLDLKRPWYRNYNQRLLYQSLWGLLIPTIFSFIIIAFYFYWYSINIFKTIWFEAYLPQIVLLLVIFNAILLFYWHRNFNGPNYKFKGTKQSNVATVLDPLEIACVFSHNKACYAVDLKGVYQVIELTIEESRTLLVFPNFFQINRSFIINLTVIEQFEIKNSKNYFVYLKAPIDNSIRHILKTEEELSKAKQSVKVITIANAQVGKYKIAQGLSQRFEIVYAAHLMAR